MGPIPPLVITKSYFLTIRLLASILQHRQDTTASELLKARKSADSDVHLAFFVRYHLDSLPAMPIALASSPGQKKVHILPPTIQSHSQSSSVQNSLSYAQESSRSGSRLFRGEGGYSASSVDNDHPPQTTHPITSAAAVFIHLPSPNGFGGTGDNSKRVSGEGVLNAAVRASSPPPDELEMHLRRLEDLRESKKSL